MLQAVAPRQRTAHSCVSQVGVVRSRQNSRKIPYRSTETQAPAVNVLNVLNGLVAVGVILTPPAEAALSSTSSVSDTSHIFLVAVVTAACMAALGGYIIGKTKDEIEEDQLNAKAWDRHRSVTGASAMGDASRELEFATASASAAGTLPAQPVKADVRAAVATPVAGERAASAPQRSVSANVPDVTETVLSGPAQGDADAVTDSKPAEEAQATAASPPSASKGLTAESVAMLQSQKAEAQAWISQWRQRQKRAAAIKEEAASAASAAKEAAAAAAAAAAARSNAAVEAKMAAALKTASKLEAATPAASSKAPHALDIPSAGNARLLTGQRLSGSDEEPNVFLRWWRALIAFLQSIWEKIVALFTGAK